MLAMIDRAVVGYAPFGSVRLVVFPEFGHAAPVYPTVEELLDRISSAGFLSFGDVRDAIARGQMKLPDLSGPDEHIRGDPLLRLDRRLATQLEFLENDKWRNALLNPQCTFYDLLKISAESPAMIIYLDTAGSKVASCPAIVIRSGGA